MGAIGTFIELHCGGVKPFRLVSPGKMMRCSPRGQRRIREGPARQHANASRERITRI